MVDWFPPGDARDTMSVCIFASEVAALTGRSPWTTPEEAVGQVLLRHGAGRDAERVRSRAERQRREAVLCAADDGDAAAAAAVAACREQVCEARDAEREALREQVRRIGALELARDLDADVHPDESASGPDASGRAVVAGARKRLRELDDEVAMEARSDRLAAAAVMGDAAKVEAAVRAEGLAGTEAERTALGAARLAAGIVQEDAALRRVEAAAPGRRLDRKQHALRRTMVTGDGVSYVLYGKVDGVLTDDSGDSTIVETKQRQRRLFGRVPDYELPQLLAYMYMARAPVAIQNEDFHGARNEHRVEFDGMLWAAIAEDLATVVDRHFGTRTKFSRD